MPVVKDIATGNKYVDVGLKYYISLFLCFCDLMLMLLACLFKSPYALWKFHKDDTFKRICMVFMGLIGGVWSGTVIQLQLADYGLPVDDPASLTLGWTGVVAGGYVNSAFGPGAADVLSYWGRGFKQLYRWGKNFLCGFRATVYVVYDED